MKKYTNQLCFYCKTRLTEEDLAVSCDACGTPHHLSCWQRDGHCAACGSPSSAEATAYMNAPAAPNYVQAPTFAPATPSTQEVISAITDRVFYTDLPLVLENTELVMDRGQGYLFARCTFRSLSVNPIKALMLTFYCRDVWGNAIEQPVCHQYLDLRAGYNDSFGGNQPLLIPDASTRSIQVSVTKVLLMDDTVLEGTGVAFTAPAPVPLTQKLQGEELLAQYRRDTTPKAQYVPAEMGAFWCCTCGALHSDASAPCSVCGCTKEQLAAALDVDALTEKANAFREEQLRKARAARAAEEERIRAAEEEARQRLQREEKIRREVEEEQKRKKKRIITWSTIAALLAAIILISVVGEPYRQYDEACRYMDMEDYEWAYDIFVELGDFKDAPTKANECLYQQACYDLDRGYLEGAFNGFEKLGNYKDSVAKMEECYFVWVDGLLDGGRGGADLDMTLTTNQQQRIYDKVWNFIQARPDVDDWNYGNTMDAMAVLDLLPEDFENVALLKKLMTELGEYAFSSIYYVRNNRDWLVQLWDVDVVQNYLLSDNQLAYFMEGYWENSTGYYHIEFYENESGSTSCSYNLPHNQPAGTKYFDMVDLHYIYEDGNDNELAKAFRFTFTDPDTVSVYCYSNGSSYKMYRD